MVDSRDADLALSAKLPEAVNRFLDLTSFDKAASETAVFLVAEVFWRRTLLQGERSDHWCVVAESGSAIALSNRAADCQLSTAPIR